MHNPNCVNVAVKCTRVQEEYKIKMTNIEMLTRFSLGCGIFFFMYTFQFMPHDISVALNTRKLWSMHLHVQAKLLQEIVRSFSGTTCQPIQHMLRRICVQLCDLASPTALLIICNLSFNFLGVCFDLLFVFCLIHP